MKIIIEQKDLDEIERKIRIQIESKIDWRVKQQVGDMISKLISDDIALRKDIHKKIIAIKQDEIDNLNAQLKDAYSLYTNRKKLK